MNTLKTIHQKMLENGFKINPQTEIAINMIKMIKFEELLQKYGDCQATQPYPAAIEVVIPHEYRTGKFEHVLVPYNKGV